MTPAPPSYNEGQEHALDADIADSMALPLQQSRQQDRRHQDRDSQP